ncbi:MAG: nitroreductase family protein [Actinomycetota bacterium]
MDTALAIASKRDVREYAPHPLPGEVLDRILDAGRVSGSARNGQPWEFVVAVSPEARERLSAAAYSPRNLTGAAAVVAIAIRGGEMQAFDAGRAAQCMMLAAWEEGVASCPNGIARPDVAHRVLGLAADQRTAVMLSFGYPVNPRDPARRPAAEWRRRAPRRPLEEVVRRL